MRKIADARILILATDGFEQSELEVPRDRLSEVGATVEIASPGGESIRGWQGEDWGQRVHADLALSSVDASAYDALVLPGGQINPDKLRIEPGAVDLVRRFHDEGKIVAAICHGPWLLVEADLIRGRKVTSYKSIRTDLVNAGGVWVDGQAVTDDRIITARSPADLDAFCDAILAELG
ncbi:type 1 glutamine amidotransferase [Paracoccus versutus]|uniref:Protease I n=1 Tax=Paracoccus versutus TaxID=34007 RepID=A0AAQ0HDL7_PARVE|nr:type 1 glutamine amidotransferase domain-containing protein [Paracoccus versutus]KGJ06906.1 glutamine amidotransferase [Paracoccus versutus]REG31403.1 protease I [Paracoccus versutus]WEJ79416.1 type 1 glutamine amidotransferase [Paracoccus versutus]